MKTATERGGTQNGPSGQKVHHEVLPNGLTLLLREVHVAPVAEVQVWAKVGSADEREGEAGLAHFHEHMLFKGTERRGVGEVAAEIEGVGGRINAYTSFDTTVYHATLPSEEMATGLDVLADAVQHSIFDADEVGREIDVVLEEIRRSEDSPHHVLSDAVFAAAYQVHPYRAPILGPPESVASFSSQKVSDFFRHWYTPDNFMVVATGDFDTARFADQVRAAFDGPAGSAQRGRPAEPAQQAARAVLLRRAFQRTCLEVTWPTIGFAHPDAALLDLLAFILGEGESSRLALRLKDRDCLADRIDASSYTPLDPGLFGASADLDAAATLPLLEGMGRELETLRLETVSLSELEKARANFLASEHWERESVSGLARKIGSFHAIAGDYRHEAKYLETVRTATPEDLLRVAREWLPDEGVTVGVVLPEAAEPTLREEALLEAFAAGTTAARRRHAPPAPRERREDVYSYGLDNGIALHVVPRREVPVVSMRAAMLGGLLAEDAPTAGLSSFLAGCWMRGTQTRSAADVAREIESLAADIDGFSGRSSIGLTLESTSDKWLPTLDLFADILLEPAFAPEEIEHERRETLALIGRRQDQLGARVFDLFTSSHFPSHPYGLPIPGTQESVGGFTREQLLAHHARLVRPQGITIAVVGDVDPHEAAAAVSQRLADLDASDTPALTLPAEEPPPSEPLEKQIELERAQAHLVIGFRGVSVRDPDREVLEVISQILGGQGGRLFLELRDRQSLAYSVSAMNVEGLAPGFFAVYIATAPEKLEQARRGMLEQLEMLLEKPPGDVELSRAKRCLVGNFAIDQQRSATRAAHISLDTCYGLGPTADRAYPARVEAITPKDITRVARRIIDLNRYTLATIHP